MAFTKYKSLGEVLIEYNLVFKKETFLDFVQPLMPPQTLIDDIDFNLKHLPYKASEIAIGENLIYPILKEIAKSFIEHLLLWSHPTITANEQLTGVPDYIFAHHTPYSTAAVGSPILITVEAKKENFDEGWGQCAAEMIAAQQLNQKLPNATIYGIVTTGEVWQFAKLNNNIFTDNLKNYTIFDINELYGVLFTIVEQCRDQISNIKMTGKTNK